MHFVIQENLLNKYKCNYSIINYFICPMGPRTRGANLFQNAFLIIFQSQNLFNKYKFNTLIIYYFHQDRGGAGPGRADSRACTYTYCYINVCIFHQTMKVIFPFVSVQSINEINEVHAEWQQ